MKRELDLNEPNFIPPSRERAPVPPRRVSLPGMLAPPAHLVTEQGTQAWRARALPIANPMRGRSARKAR